MKLKEILRDVNIIESTADLEMEITGVCYDSRLVKPGNLFVAIRGFETDGHRYIPKAVESGAAAVLPLGTDAGLPPWSCAGQPSFLRESGRLNDHDRHYRHQWKNKLLLYPEASAGDRPGRQGRPDRHQRQYDRRYASPYGAHDAGEL